MRSLWVGWYGQAGANANQPASIFWTEGAGGDCFRECWVRLEASAPPGRILQVLLRGDLAGRDLLSAAEEGVSKGQGDGGGRLRGEPVPGR